MHPTVIAIKKELRRLGMTYRQFSEASGMDESKIKRLLGGSQSMTLEDRDQLCEALGWTIVDIRGAGSDQPIDTEVLALIKALPRRTQHDLIALITSMLHDLSARKKPRK